jgi:hypothetical protein
MLDIVENNMPMGGIGWDEVSADFNVWAAENERCERTPDSLKRKFESVRPISYSFLAILLTHL